MRELTGRRLGPSWGLLGAFLGPSWGARGRLGALLGRSRGFFGVSWGTAKAVNHDSHLLGAIWGPSRASSGPSRGSVGAYLGPYSSRLAHHPQQSEGNTGQQNKRETPTSSFITRTLRAPCNKPLPSAHVEAGHCAIPSSEEDFSTSHGRFARSPEAGLVLP